MAISRGNGFSLIGAGEAERVTGRYVTAGLRYRTRRQAFARSHPLLRGEDEPGVGPVVLISQDLWQAQVWFGARRNSRGITLDDKNYAVIGVIPASPHGIPQRRLRTNWPVDTPALIDRASPWLCMVLAG